VRDGFEPPRREGEPDEGRGQESQGQNRMMSQVEDDKQTDVRRNQRSRQEDLAVARFPLTGRLRC
jgi:hypothetical protein